MRVSEQWLRELVDPPVDTDTLCEQLTLAGLEVDLTEPAAADFSGVVVARIESVAAHPDADKLRVCQVSTGQPDLLQIVCGAPNAAEGLLVPLATVGGELPGMKIKKAKLRGVESFGMLCSARELGLQDDVDGLMVLPVDAPLGASLRDYLKLDDTVIEIDLTPNRGDCLSMHGVAREVSVANSIDIDLPVYSAVTPELNDVLDIRVDSIADCPRYAGRVIREINPAAAAPIWMRERLRRAGIGSISLPVDVTNYVMLEMGQPMHAFNLDKLSGGINVRRSKTGEQIELLDGQSIDLSENSLLITDDNGPVALAGIMGGAGTAVDAQTTNLFMESACFSQDAVAGWGRHYKLHTDSLHRFERGVDPQLQIEALERATALIIEYAGGQAGPVTVVGEPEPAAGIVLRRERIARILGVTIDDETVENCFRRLGLDFEPVDTGWSVSPPGYRYDLRIEVDLIEELARIHGMDRLSNPDNVVMLPQLRSNTGNRGRALRQALVQRGYQEIVSYSFSEPSLLESLHSNTDQAIDQTIDLDNPISDQLSRMRDTLWAGLIPAWKHNMQRQAERIRLFEVASVFTRAQNAEIDESKRLSGLVWGDVQPEQWGEGKRIADFHDVKADIEALFRQSGLLTGIRFEKAEHAALHPGQTARIHYHDQAIGWIGTLNPNLNKVNKNNILPILFDVNYSIFEAADTFSFENLSEQPVSRRDLALNIPEKCPVDSVLACIRAVGEKDLIEVRVFDVYTGEGLQEGFKSVALGLIFQNNSRTLTDQEIDNSVNVLQTRLRSELDITIRG